MKRIVAFLLLAAMLLTLSACSQTVPNETDTTEYIESETLPAETETEPETEPETDAKPVNPLRKRDDELYIGVYSLSGYARTEEHIKDLADSGVNFVMTIGQNNRETLDLLHKYGVSAVASGVIPGWGSGSDSLKRLEQRYSAKLKSFNDHPAILGFHFVDEPSALSFEKMGKIVALVQEACPEQFVHVNLYPNYASEARGPSSLEDSDLGAVSYQDYIDAYCRYVPTNYICFDFYPYHYAKRFTKDDPNNGVSDFYENLRIVAEACRSTGRELWLVGQVNSSRKHTFITTNQLRFQAYTAMAFGMTTIQWACYTGGWWYNHVLDENGNKTEQYDKMKTVNWEIHTIAEEYMKYRNTATHFVGFAPDSPELAHLNQEVLEQLDTDVFSDVKADNGAPLVIGEMVSRKEDGSCALMICASDDSHDFENQSYNIIFRVNDRTVRAIGGEGEIPVTALGDGYYSVPICSNAGILITAE